MNKINKIKEKIKNSIGKSQLSFLNHTKNYFIGNIATQALSFLSVPIFSRLLIPAEYGMVSVFTSVTQIITIFLMLGFHSAVTRNYNEKDGEFPVFLGSVTIFLVVYNAAFIFVLYLLKEYLSKFFAISPALFFLGCINAFLSVIITLYLYYLQASKKSKRYAVISFVKSALILVVAAIWVIILSDERHLGRIYGMVAVNAAVLIFSIIKVIQIASFKYSWTKVKYALQYGVPLIPHIASGFILAQFDRLIINQLNGFESAGMYSFAYNVGMLMNVVVMSMNRSWLPIFYSKLREEKHKEIHNLVKSNSKIVLLIALGLICFSKEMIYVLADPKYYPSVSLVPIIVLGYVLVYFYTIYSNYAFYRKKTYLISLNTIVACVVNIVLNYIYIPRYGYTAAAYTTLISYAVLYILHFINTKLILKESAPKVKNYSYSALIFAALVGVFYIVTNFEIHWLLLIFFKILIVGVYAVYMFKDAIKNKIDKIELKIDM